MKTILNVLFDDNLNYTVMLFLVVLLIIEFIVLYDKERRKKVSGKAAFLIVTISTLFASAIIVTSDAANDYYSAWAKPKETGCLLDMYKGHDYYYYALYLHYFEGKQLYICDDVDTKLEIAAHIMQYEKTLPVEIGGEDYSSFAVTSQIGKIDNNTHALEKDGRRFILDKTWKNVDRIICVQNGEQVYFLSEQLYTDAANNDCEKDYLSRKELSLGSMQFLEEQRGEGVLNQTLLLVCFFVVGWFTLQLAFNGKHEWLSFFMSFPVGVSLAGALGVLFIVIGIPFRKKTILTMFFLVLLVEVFLFIKKKIKLTKQSVLRQSIVSIALNLLVSYLMIFSKQGDSFYKTGYGIFLAEFLPDKTEILSYMDFGLLEPIIHAIGWKFHTDFLYGFYLLMGICTVGILIFSIGYLFEVYKIRNFQIVMLICIMILITNVDYLGISVWVLTNGSMACLYLLILVSAIFALKDQMNPAFVVAISAISCIVARVEGTCYLCLVLVILCGLKKYREKFWLLNVMVGIEAILWQLFVNKYLESSTFLTTEKSIIAILGGMVTIAVPFVMRTKGRLFDFIRTHYYKLCITAFVFLSFVFVMGGTEMGYSTAKIFVRHFGASDCSNSAAFWGFSVLMLPLLLKNRKKESRMLVSYVIIYLLMTYTIFSIRTNDPIHEMYYDSCRRVISQVMPTVMFVVMYVLFSIILETDFRLTTGGTVGLGDGDNRLG